MPAAVTESSEQKVVCRIFFAIILLFYLIVSDHYFYCTLFNVRSIYCCTYISLLVHCVVFCFFYLYYNDVLSSNTFCFHSDRVQGEIEATLYHSHSSLLHCQVKFPFPKQCHQHIFSYVSHVILANFMESYHAYLHIY